MLKKKFSLEVIGFGRGNWMISSGRSITLTPRNAGGIGCKDVGTKSRKSGKGYGGAEMGGFTLTTGRRCDRSLEAFVNMRTVSKRGWECQESGDRLKESTG